MAGITGSSQAGLASEDHAIAHGQTLGMSAWEILPASRDVRGRAEDDDRRLAGARHRPRMDHGRREGRTRCVPRQLGYPGVNPGRPAAAGE